MRIFIRKISTRTTRADLMRFVEGAVKSRFRMPLGTSAEVRACEIMEIYDLDLRTLEYHGLVEVFPDKAAEAAIRKLNGRLLNGRKVMVREYTHRSRYNGESVKYQEKRRRNLQVSFTKRIVTEGMQQFLRKFG